MQIIPLHYKKSQPVESYSQIKPLIKKMLDFVDNGPYVGLHQKAFAIAHAQVSEDPFCFFVVHSEHVPGMFKHRVIINPKILSMNQESDCKVPEGCMSVPFRQMKNITRYGDIEVEYQVPTTLGRLKTIVEQVGTVKAQIFQHEIEHMEGKNIYFQKKK